MRAMRHEYPSMTRGVLKSFFWRRQWRLPSPLTRLWFDPDGRTTVTPDAAKEALLVLDPVADCATELTDWVARITAASSRSIRSC
jgi:hypothetical protein